jgi:hypothetical protein
MEQLSAVENQNLFSQKTTIYEMSLGNFKKTVQSRRRQQRSRPEKARLLRSIARTEIAG